MHLGSGLVQQQDGTWIDGQCTHYQFQSLADALASTTAPLGGAPRQLASAAGPYVGVWKVTGGSVGGNEIDVSGFDLQTAVNVAFDVISIPKAVAITPGASVTPILAS